MFKLRNSSAIQQCKLQCITWYQLPNANCLIPIQLRLMMYHHDILNVKLNFHL